MLLSQWTLRAIILLKMQSYYGFQEAIGYKLKKFGVKISDVETVVYWTKVPRVLSVDDAFNKLKYFFSNSKARRLVLFTFAASR
jgi:hypothetical protein